MKVRVVDDEALGSLRPRDIRLYLRIHGWTRVPRLSKSRTDAEPDVWSLPSDGGSYEIIAPSSRSSRDFTSRAAELLRTLSIAEQRSELDILRDFSTLSFDIQYFRTINSGPPGTAPLRDAVESFAAAQVLVSASTASMEVPRLVLPPRRPPRTSEFMKRVLAGPTLEGSYIISVWVPIPPRLTQEEDAVLFDDPSEPFERSATRHLHRALAAARAASNEALDNDDGLDAFITRESQGVSANLCEAIAALSGEEDQELEVRFAWALDRPVADLPAAVSFSTESIPVLREAARELRARLPEDEVTLRGNVVRLHREEQLGAGDVTIAGVLIGDASERLRRVSVNLSEPDYQLAINAHESFAEVEISGSVVQRGTRTYMMNSRGLELRHAPGY